MFSFINDDDEIENKIRGSNVLGGYISYICTGKQKTKLKSNKFFKLNKQKMKFSHFPLLLLLFFTNPKCKGNEVKKTFCLMFFFVHYIKKFTKRGNTKKN